MKNYLLARMAERSTAAGLATLLTAGIHAAVTKDPDSIAQAISAAVGLLAVLVPTGGGRG